MLLNELLSKKNEILKIIKRNKGSNVMVFGSTAEGTSNKSSDVDFLVELNDDASLFDLIEIKLELEELLNVKVDVVSENGLKDNEIGKNIRRSAIAI